MGIRTFYGLPEQIFWLVSQAEEIHTARYQIACAAISAGKKPIIYGTGKTEYDNKYIDLLELLKQTKQTIINNCLIQCETAAKAAKNGKV